MISDKAKVIKELLRKNSGWNRPLNEIRQVAKAMSRSIKLPECIEICNVNADGVNTELFTSVNGKEDKLIIYFHGGGYCLGIENINRRFIAKMSEESGYKILLVDYRLAPEDPYPAAHEDALTVYKWVIRNKFKPQDLVLMGDSSGCGLILATLFKIREFWIAMPAAVVLISPVVDYTRGSTSLITRKELDPYRYDDPFSIVNNFLGNNDVKNPLISPLYGDLSGIPPILIHASDHDVFLSDSISLAEKVRSVGVEVDIKIWEGLWHVFHLNADKVPEGREALKEIYSFIDKKIGN